MAVGKNEEKSVDKSLELKKSVQASIAQLNKGNKKGAKELLRDIGGEKDIGEDQVMLVVFPVGDEEYAMEIDEIKEVVPAPKLAPIPQTEKYVLGVGNVRGTVLAILDLAIKFGLKEKEKTWKKNKEY